MTLQEFQLDLEFFRQPFVVAIQKGDPFSLGGADAGITGGAGAGVDDAVRDLLRGSARRQQEGLPRTVCGEQVLAGVAFPTNATTSPRK